MDLGEFIQRYTDEVYGQRDPEAAARFIADPCLRHEHGHLVTMSLADNIARIRSFLDSAPEAAFENAVFMSDGEHIVSCFNVVVGSGESSRTLSGMELFRVVDGKITETWNSSVQPGAWG